VSSDSFSFKSGFGSVVRSLENVFSRYARAGAELELNRKIDPRSNEILNTEGIRRAQADIGIRKEADVVLDRTQQLGAYAEEAVVEIRAAAADILTLSDTASNVVTSSTQRAALDNEIQALATKIDDVRDDSTFNGQNIFSSSYGVRTLQLSASANKTATYQYRDLTALDVSSFDVTTYDAAVVTLDAADQLYGNTERELAHVAGNYNRFLVDDQINVSQLSAAELSLANQREPDKETVQVEKDLTALQIPISLRAYKEARPSADPVTSLVQVVKDLKK